MLRNAFVSLTVTINVFYSFTANCNEIGIQSRIIGGAYCDLRDPEVNYKFMVSLRTYDEDFDFYEHFCGGTLVSEYWVLTAGHCFKPKTIYVVEAYRIDEIEYTGPATKVASRIPHPKFDNETNHHDIALMLLSTPITKNEHVVFVCLPYPKTPDSSEILTGDKCSRFTVMGWGQTNKDEEERWFPLRLECLDLNLITLDECRRAHEDHKRNKTVYNQNICTEGSTATDFWKGDSGGPLLCGDVQYGIVSWGYGALGYPSVYTRVDEYLDFIRENVCRAAGA